MNKDDINKFHLAAEQGDIATVISCVETFPDLLDSTDRFGNTALMKAAFFQQQDIVTLLLAKGANPDLENIDGIRALSGAIFKQDIDITEMLLNAGAEVNYIDGQDRSPLMWAVDTNENKMIPMLEMLLAKYGANVNLLNSKNASALHYVARNGNEGMCASLLRHGANTFSVRASIACTPLMEAIIESHPDLAELLIDSDPSLDIHHVYDASSVLSAPGIAIQLGVERILQRFFDKGSQLAQDSVAIVLATQAGRNESVKMLLANDADINARDSKGNTALLIAINDQSIDIVLTLLKGNADITIPNFKGVSPLILLAERGEVLKAILQTEFATKILTSKIDSTYGSILSYASAKGLTKAVSAMLEAGADIEDENEEGNTALTLAVSQGNVEVVKALIEGGANIHHTNRGGLTPLSIAVENYKKGDTTLMPKARQIANFILDKMDEAELAENSRTVFMKYIIEDNVWMVNFMIQRSKINLKFIEDYIHQQEESSAAASKKSAQKRNTTLEKIKKAMDVIQNGSNIISIQNAFELIDLASTNDALKVVLAQKIRNEGTLDELSKLLEIELHYAPSVGYKLAFLTSQEIRGLDTRTLSEEATQKLKLIESIYRYEASSKTYLGQPIDQIESAIDCFQSNAQEMVVDSIIFQNFRNIVQIIKASEGVDPELNDILLKFDQFELLTTRVKQFCHKPAGKIAPKAKGAAASHVSEDNPFQIIKSKAGEFNKLSKSASQAQKAALKLAITDQVKVILNLLEDIAALRMVEIDITELVKLIGEVNSDLSSKKGLGDCLINHSLAPISAAKPKVVSVAVPTEEEGFDGGYTFENLKKYAKYVVSGKGDNLFCKQVEEGFIPGGEAASAKSKTSFNIKFYRSASDVFASQKLDIREFKDNLAKITLAYQSLTEDRLMKYMITSREKGGDGILPTILDGIMSYVDDATYYSRSATSVGAASYFGTLRGTICPDEDDRMADFAEDDCGEMSPVVAASGGAAARIFDTSKLPELKDRMKGLLYEIMESNFAKSEISLPDVKKLIIALGEQNFTGRETASGYLVKCAVGTRNTHNPHEGDNVHPSFIADLKELFLETGVWEYYQAVDAGFISFPLEGEERDIVEPVTPGMDPYADMPPLLDDEVPFTGALSDLDD